MHSRRTKVAYRSLSDSKEEENLHPRQGSSLHLKYARAVSTTGPTDLRCDKDHLPEQKGWKKKVTIERWLLAGSILSRPVE